MKKIFKFFINHWKPIIFSLSIVIFVFITKLLLKDELYVFDSYIYNIVTHYNNHYLTSFFKFVSFLCSTCFIFALVIFILVFIKNKKIGIYMGINVFLCFMLNQNMKFIFARNRPVDINLVLEKGYSFPSGHAMLSMAFYGFIIYIIAHMKIPKRRKILICFLLGCLILLIGISRIYLGVHFASDVLAGFALSMAYLILFILFFYKKLDI